MSHQQQSSYGDRAMAYLTDWRIQDQTYDPWVQSEWFIHYTMVAPILGLDA